MLQDPGPALRLALINRIQWRLYCAILSVSLTISPLPFLKHCHLVNKSSVVSSKMGPHGDPSPVKPARLHAVCQRTANE